MAITMIGPIRGTTSRDELLLSSERWNRGLKRQAVKVIRPFYWEGRLLEPGDTAVIPSADAADMVFRGKAQKA